MLLARTRERSLRSRPERVAKIAESRFGLDPTSVLDNIRIARVFNVDDQLDLNLAMAAMLADEEGTGLQAVRAAGA